MVTSDNSRPPTAAEKFAQRNADGDDAFDRARPRSRESMALDVVLRSGKRHGLAWSYLVRTDFVPGDTIRLVFASTTVGLEGRNLRDLYEALLEHRVRSVFEGSDRDDMGKAEADMHIDKITIKENE